MTAYKQIILNGSVLKERPFQREFELQGYLIAHPELLSLAEMDEQFQVSGIIGVERSLKNGRVDMVVEYRSGRIAIVELKRGEVVRKDLDQLRGYLDDLASVRQWKAFDDYKKENDEFDKVVSNTNVFGILVGRSISQEVETELGNNSNNIINTLTVRRYRAEFGEYLVTDASTHFPKRDYRKYSVNGRGPLGKGRMVLEAIRAYVVQNPDINYERLVSKDVFPPYLRGTNQKWGCVALLNEATQLAEKTGRKRHFLESDDVIPLKDNRRIVVSSQWGIGNISGFIKRAKELGVTISEVKSQGKTTRTQRISSNTPIGEGKAVKR